MRTRSKVVAVLVAATLAAASCGGDDGDATTTPSTSVDGGATTAPDGGTDTTVGEGTDTTTAPDDGGDTGSPAVGGEATVLVWNEVAGVDPNVNSPSGSATGVRDFALYGALIVQPAGSTELEPLIAESLEVDDTFRVWTLKLRDGITFSDGTAYDAEAVKVNWERIQDPESRSPAYSYATAIASLTVVDPLTLEIELTEPSVLFDRIVSRTALNHIASPTAITGGHDLQNDPVGAGPFLLDSWVRDDRMVLVRNPDYFDAPRPYLDKVTLRVVTDEEQRIDTMRTGGGDVLYTTNPQTVQNVIDDGFDFIGAAVGTGTVVNYNVTTAPFDDVRIRQAVAIGVDYQALLETVQGPAAVAADNFAADDAPWRTDESALGGHDVAEATRLIEEYLADTGTSTLELNIMSGPNHIPMAEFVQTALSQIDNVSVSVETVDQPTLISRSYAHDYQMTFWGYPTVNPDPDLYQAVVTGNSTNSMGYSNADVDRLFAEGRTTPDTDARNQLYAELYAQLAADIPFVPIRHGQNGWAHDDGIDLPALYSDGVPRLDLMSAT